MTNEQFIQKDLTATDNFSRSKFWLKAFAVYALAEALFWVFHYFNLYSREARWLLPAPYYLMQWLLNVLFTAGVWYLLNRFYGSKWTLFIIINAIVFALHYVGWIAILFQLHSSGWSWVLGNHAQPLPVENFIRSSWFDVGKYVLKIAAFYVLKFYSEYRRTEQDRIRLAVINKDLQLNLLKQQLSPHFYFNTLNNLYGLARSNNPKLSQALQQLSNIMRYVIEECNQPKVSLQKEIDFLQSYIALEKLRYEESTVIEMEVVGNVNGHTILPLLLIQFVENAFKHGMKEKSEQNWMKVKMEIRKPGLLFLVDNSYQPVLPAEGIGLYSVKHRLNLLYDGKYDMKMDTSDGKFSVVLKLDLN